MERSWNQWELMFRQSSFFYRNIEMWQIALENYGGINIVYIIGVQEHVNRDFHGNIVQALTDPGFGNLLNIRITQLIDQYGRFNNSNNHRNRIRFLTWIRMQLRDRHFAQHYAEHIQNLGAIYLPSQDNAPQISLRDAISKQVRRPAPVPANNPQEDKYCRHCVSFDHETVKCKIAGGVRNNNRGIPIALGENPRCFICARRHKKWSDTVFHDSRTCGFRHPLSRIGLKRKCKACNWSMKRCWNCAEPICLNKFCRNYGHRSSRCPRPRYQPLSSARFGDAFSRMTLSERMAAVGIQHIPRELCYLPDPNQAQEQQPQPNRGQINNSANRRSNLPNANQTSMRDDGRSTSRNNVQSIARIDCKSTSKNDGQHSKKYGQSASNNADQSTSQNDTQSTSHEAMQNADFVPEIDITEDILNICQNEDLAEKDICSICFEQLEIEEIGVLECGHRYHSDCINHWRKYKQNFCPFCRRPLILKSTDLPAGTRKRDKTRWTDETSLPTFHLNPELYQGPSAYINQDDPLNDVGAMLIQTIEIIQRDVIDERAFRVLNDLAIAVRDRGIDWDDELSHEYIAAVFFHLGRLNYPRIKQTILPAILNAITTLEQYDRVFTALRQLSPDLGHHLQQIEFINEEIRARRVQLAMRPFPDQVAAPNIFAINPEQLTIEYIRRSIADFEGFAISLHAMNRVRELETHIREHGIVWNEITYPLVGALLHGLTRSEYPQYRSTTMPLIFGQINTAEQLRMVIYHVNSHHPNEIRKQRMKPFLDQCLARFT